ncbi:MAG: hypothetical protein ACI8SJ_002715, partial [Shewanella sp.]
WTIELFIGMKQANRHTAPVFSALSGDVKGKSEPVLSVSLESINEPLAVMRADKGIELSSSNQLLAPLFGVNTAAELMPTAESDFESVDREKGGTKSALYSSTSRLLYLFIWAILLHVILIGIINQFWGGQTLKVTAVTPIKIQSYLYVEPTPPKNKAVDSIDSAKTNDASQSHLTTDSSAAIYKEQLVETLPVVKPTIKIEKAFEPETATTGLSEETDTRMDDSAPRAVSESSVSKGAVSASTSKKRGNAMAFAQSYLQRKNDAALDALIIDKAKEYTRPHSLSEMDGDMVELVFPEVDEYSKVPTTDHRLDPNRIVRQGDTCFRIVQVPTQINPYAENIGYPFNCGGDKVKKAINEAISARLEKRMISRKKESFK